MSMVAGSVTVADDESRTGSGMAVAIYDARAARYATLLTGPGFTPPSLGQTSPPFALARPATQADIDQVKAQRLALLRGVALDATADAYAIVSYIQAHATAGGDPVT